MLKTIGIVSNNTYKMHHFLQKQDLDESIKNFNEIKEETDKFQNERLIYYLYYEEDLDKKGQEVIDKLRELFNIVIEQKNQVINDTSNGQEIDGLIKEDEYERIREEVDKLIDEFKLLIRQDLGY